MYEDELVDALECISSDLRAMDRTLFDTLASGKVGDALDAIAELPEKLERVGDELEGIRVALSAMASTM